ncbi:head decoration protein [Acinetobacter nematophilus]|uniref:Head decoration protein n=1 Tax=Acinetobacter nematophilus TaxID=2994642 RepID=A0A9X3DQC1_9GAMM|nr:head decoration protein [Acinetobacter nematophilus]MCX5466498.1 head decoration protein [Acinetobacter nematophilus]
MPSYTQPTYLSDVLLVEVKEGWTKETILIAPSTVALSIGMVLAQLASGEFAPIDLAGSAPANKATAILASDVEASTTAQKAVVIKRGAVVAKNNLIWSDTATAEDVETALADLEVLGIVARNSF